MENYFIELNNIDCSKKIERKNGLTYLSWAWAWGELKKKHPNATYNIKKFGENNLPFVYDENTGYMVFTEVTVEKITHEMWLPVMDSANKAMKKQPYEYKTKYGVKTCEAADMFDINKTIMRCLVKNIAMFGLGLYIYAGEDLPESEKTKSKVPEKMFIDISQTTEEKQLEEIWNKNPELQKEADFRQAITNQKNKLNEQK